MDCGTHGVSQANVTAVSSSDPPMGISRLESLPPELLRMILEYTLPQGYTISFSRFDRYGSPQCLLHDDDEEDEAFYRRERYMDKQDYKERMLTSLLYTNKFLANEARAILSAGNTFLFTISALPHTPISLKSPLIFGPLGLPHRHHLLRDLRHIALTVDIDCTSAYAVTRHRARLQHFAEVLTSHPSTPPLLTHLRVTLSTARLPHSMAGAVLMNTFEGEMAEKHMFVLEPLAEVQGIRVVEIFGVPAWFARCLAMRMRGEGGVLETLVWPESVVRRVVRRGRCKRRKVLVEERKGWQPVRDWRGFARRNGIEVPVGVERFFPEE